MARKVEMRSVPFAYIGATELNCINKISITSGNNNLKAKEGEKSGDNCPGYARTISNMNRTPPNQNGGYISRSIQSVPDLSKLRAFEPAISEEDYIATREYNRSITSGGEEQQLGEPKYGYTDYINPNAPKKEGAATPEADPIYEHLDDNLKRLASLDATPCPTGITSEDSIPLPSRTKKKGMVWLFGGQQRSKSVSKELHGKPEMTKSQSWHCGDDLKGYGSYPNNDSYFDVQAEKKVTESGSCIEGPLRILLNPKALCLHSLSHNLIFTWPFEYIRTSGTNKEENIFTLEVGRRSESGPGVFRFKPRGKYHPDLIANDLQHRIMSRQKEIQDATLCKGTLYGKPKGKT